MTGLVQPPHCRKYRELHSLGLILGQIAIAAADQTVRLQEIHSPPVVLVLFGSRSRQSFRFVARLPDAHPIDETEPVCAHERLPHDLLKKYAAALRRRAKITPLMKPWHHWFALGLFLFSVISVALGVFVISQISIERLLSEIGELLLKVEELLMEL